MKTLNKSGFELFVWGFFPISVLICLWK